MFTLFALLLPIAAGLAVRGGELAQVPSFDSDVTLLLFNDLNRE
jgi:hypothetical protein